MAETVYLLDGSMEVILEPKDLFLEKLIREKLGDDAARCFREHLAELNDEHEYTGEQVKEFEEAADGYLQLCHDACDFFTEIMGLLEAPRLNREALKRATRNAYEAIWENL